MKIVPFLDSYWGDIPAQDNPATAPVPRTPCVMVYKTIPSFKSMSEAYAVVIIPEEGGPIVKASAYDVETAGVIAAAISRQEDKANTHGAD